MTLHCSTPPVPGWRARGFSLIELMVALAIGLVVIGAVFVNYLNTSATSRHNAALRQMNEDASLALGILRNHIAMAGFAVPRSVSAQGNIVTDDIGKAIEGCSNGPMTRNVQSTAVNVATVTFACSTTTGNGESLLVRYQTDTSSSPLTQNGLPEDCLGNGILSMTPVAAPTYLSQANFYIATDGNGVPSLSCLGSGGAAGTSGQALVANIYGMQVRYGLSSTTSSADARALPSIVRYVPTASMQAADWDRVKAVRICLIVRSSEEILSAQTGYVGCDGSAVPVATGDRHLYRAFTTTILLNNRNHTL